MHPLGAGRSPTDELERKTAHDTVYFTPPRFDTTSFPNLYNILYRVQISKLPPSRITNFAFSGKFHIAFEMNAGKEMIVGDPETKLLAGTDGQ